MSTVKCSAFPRTGSYYVWNRWGRVGEPGQNALKGPFSKIEDAAKEFKKKFLDKTKNKWENRDSFVPSRGKYTLIEMDDDSDGEQVRGNDEQGSPQSLRGIVRGCVPTSKTYTLHLPQYLTELLQDSQL